MRRETVPEAIEGIWKVNGAETGCKIFFVQLANFFHSSSMSPDFRSSDNMVMRALREDLEGGTPHGRSSVGFRLALPTRLRKVKKSEAIRRNPEFATCAK